MRALFTQLSKESLIYGVGGALGTVIGVLLTPVLTRIFQPSDYGIIELITTSITIMTIFMTMGMDAAMGIKFFAESDPMRRRNIIATTLSFTTACAVALAGILIVLARPISVLLFQSPEYAAILRVAIAGLPLAIAFNFILETIRFHFRPWAYTALSFSRAVIVVVSTYWLVAVAQTGVSGVFWASVIGSAIVLTVGLLLFGRYVGGRPAMDILRGLLRVGLPLIPAGLAGWALNLLDRYFLLHYRDLADVGLYSLGVRVASVLTLFVSAFQLSWSPFSLSVAKRPNAKQFYASVLTIYTIIGCGLALGISLYGPEIISIFATQKYAAAASVIAPSAFSWIAFGAYYIVAVGVTIAQKTEHISWTTMTAALLNAGLNFLLIPRYGMMGAALATLIAYLVSSALLWRVAQRFYPIPFRLQPIIVTVVLSSAALLLGTQLTGLSLWLGILSKAGVLALWVVACFWLVLDHGMRQAALKLIRRQPTEITA